MKSVDIREFRDKASHYLTSKEILTVKRHGKFIGVYIPVKESEDEEVRQAIDRLGQTVESIIAESGWDEETLSRALDLSLPD